MRVSGRADERRKSLLMTERLPTSTQPIAKDKYANLNARAASPEAQALVAEVYEAISHWELQTGRRSYERRGSCSSSEALVGIV